MLLQLPEPVRESILRSLTKKDRISVSATCRTLLKDVEALSKSELDRIEREHAVDDTWRYRIGMRVAAEFAQKAQNEFGRQQRLSPCISYRRLLRAAYQTHLYSLGTNIPARHLTACRALAMNSDGTQMISGGYGSQGDPSILRLWDLNTKECIKSFIGHSGFCIWFSFGAGHVLSASLDNTMRIWDQQDGSCKNVLDLAGMGCCHFEIIDGTVFILDFSECVFRAIDIQRGSTKVFPTFRRAWTDTVPEFMRLCACGTRLLVLRGFEDEGTARREHAGIYLFNPSTMGELSWYRGNYCSIRCSTDGQHIVAASAEGDYFDVLHLEGDCIVHRHSLETPSAIATPVQNDPVLAVFGSKEFAFLSFEPPDYRRVDHIKVFNLSTGAVERSLGFAAADAGHGTLTPECVAANEKEIFVGFNMYWQRNSVGTQSIKAYLR